jgi:hypothetical protein
MAVAAGAGVASFVLGDWHAVINNIAMNAVPNLLRMGIFLDYEVNLTKN